MAKSKKNGSAAKKASTVKAAPAKKAVAKTTDVRNSARPRVAASKALPVAVKPLEITDAMISERAYHIHLSGAGGSQDENWHRAERELRGL